MLSLGELAGRLQRVKWRGDSALTALCPAHEDGSASLSVGVGNDGRLLFKCFTGCESDAIRRALGLEWRDILPEREAPQQARPAASRERAWVIRDPKGAILAEHIRIEDPKGGKRFVWRRNGKSGLDGLSAADMLYRAETVAGSQGHVWICEGEKAADAAARLGLAAVGTVCGASSCPTAGALEVLRGREVILWPDNDQPGRDHMARLADALQGIANSVQWVEVPGAKPKADAADYAGDQYALAKYVRAMRTDGPVRMFAESIDDAEAELERVGRGDTSRHVSTGVPSLDQRLGGGLRRGQVTLLGAPAGVGKTSLVVQFAMTAQQRGTALVVSPEMSPEELVTREIVRRSGKGKWELTADRESQRAEAKRLHAAAIADLRENPPDVALFDALTVSLDEVAEAARALAKRKRLSLIALDYAQQLAEEKPDTPRYLAVGAVALRAIDMAREFDCAVLVTSQVNVFRDGKEKGYAIRESANLEQKANNVLLFIVEREENGSVKQAYFRATKVRDGALFKLDVDWRPATFSVGDKPEERDFRDVRDWRG